MCGSMADIQSPTAEIRRGIKKEERNSMKIYMVSLFMVALWNRADHYIFMLFLLLLLSYFFFISSPNLSGQRLDVYHTSTHGVALVRI